MGTFRITDCVEGKNRYPEQMGMIGLGNRGQCVPLVAMRTAYIFQGFGLFFSRSASEEKDHTFRFVCKDTALESFRNREFECQSFGIVSPARFIISVHEEHREVGLIIPIHKENLKICLVIPVRKKP